MQRMDICAQACVRMALVLAATYWLSSLVCPALAQQQRPTAAAANTFKSPANLKQDWQMNKPLEVSTLKEPVSLQDVPDFSGHKTFVTGNTHDSDSGTSWFMRFRVKESKEQVIDWYQNVLKINNWKVTGSNSDAVTANKSGLTFQLLVQPLRRNRDFPTQMEITYFQPKSRK